MKKLFGLTLALVLCSLIGRAKPAHAFTCAEICGADYTSCRTDCRFTPYQGCPVRLLAASIRPASPTADRVTSVTSKS